MYIYIYIYINPGFLLVSCSSQWGNSSHAPGRTNGQSYFKTGSTNFTAVSFMYNDFTAVGNADKSRASRPSAPPSTGRSTIVSSAALRVKN